MHRKLESSPYEFCSDCVYWLQCKAPEGLEGDWGECHLDPPSIVDPKYPFRTHILTSEDDFCSRAVLRVWNESTWKNYVRKG